MNIEDKNSTLTVSQLKSPRQILFEAYNDFRWLFTHLLTFVVFFQILTFAVFSPFTAWIIGTLIASAGDPAVSNFQIISFILSPIGIVWLLLGGTLSSTTNFVQQSGLMLIGSSRLSGERLSFIKVIWFTLKEIPELLGLALLQTLLYVLASIPFVGIGAIIYFSFLAEYNINYYLTFTPPSFWTAIGLAILVLLTLAGIFAYLYLRWIFALPVVVFEDTRFYAALQRSHSLVKGNFRRIAITIFTWVILMAIVTLSGTLLIQTIGNFVLKNIGDDLRILASASGFMLALSILFFAITSFANTAINSLLILHLYFERRTQEGANISNIPQPELEENVVISGQRVSFRKILWFAAISILILTVITAFAIVESLPMKTPVLVTAHRGYSSRAPENTISAIEKAAEAGADFAEIDVQETADGVLVLLHDSDLMKTAGIDKNIWEVTYDEIKDVDIGSWFSPQFAGENIATLDEAIEVSKGKIKLMIELKYNGHDQNLAEKIVQAVKENGLDNQVIIHSLNYEGLQEVKQLNPNLTTGYIVGATLGNVSRIETDWLNLETSIATADTIDSTNAEGKRVGVWTVNNREQMIKMINRGAGNIITDEPELLIDVQQELSQLSNTEKFLLAFGDWIDD